MITFVVDGQSCYSPESCVYDHVFSDYNTRVRPATDPAEVIRINASVTATSLTGIVRKCVFCVEATRGFCGASIVVHCGYSQFAAGCGGGGGESQPLVVVFTSFDLA